MIRRIAMATGGTVVVALVLTLAVPRTAHAVFSALVTITNTAANPVPTQSVDNPALAPSFSVAVVCSTFNDATCENSIPSIIPSGMTAVVKDISGHCRFPTVDSAPTLLYVSGGNHGLDSTGAFTGFSVELTPILVGQFAGLEYYDFGRETTLYAPSTTASQGSFRVTGQISNLGDCTVNLSGYYVKNGQ
jgi:hypothetical protein